jgi:hypothetical protein
VRGLKGLGATRKEVGFLVKTVRIGQETDFVVHPELKGGAAGAGGLGAAEVGAILKGLEFVQHGGVRGCECRRRED